MPAKGIPKQPQSVTALASKRSSGRTSHEHDRQLPHQCESDVSAGEVSAQSARGGARSGHLHAVGETGGGDERAGRALHDAAPSHHGGPRGLSRPREIPGGAFDPSRLEDLGLRAIRDLHVRPMPVGRKRAGGDSAERQDHHSHVEERPKQDAQHDQWCCRGKTPHNPILKR